MKIMVIGRGGREHALIKQLSQSKHQPELYAAPGNPGMNSDDYPVQRLDIQENDTQGLLLFAKREGIDLTIIGPEAPLADGLVDMFTKNNMLAFGPNKACAKLEASKRFAKEMMEAAGVPTAKYVHATTQADALKALDDFDAPYVIKEDGLAAGKGVTVTENKNTAIEAINKAFTKNMTVVLEGFLEGEELSVLALCDGKQAIPLIGAQDFKRLNSQPDAPNTGGMGAYAPVPLADEALLKRVQTEVLNPMMATLQERGLDYRGVLYAGLMVDQQGNPSVVEFNVRFGDPETQVVLPLLDEDLVDVLIASAKGDLSAFQNGFKFKPASAVTVVMVSEGYPSAYDKGKPLNLPESGTMPDASWLIHAGTKRMNPNTIVTDGGRVINAVALGGSVDEARQKAYQLCEQVGFAGKVLRDDIAKPVVNV